MEVSREGEGRRGNVNFVNFAAIWWICWVTLDDLLAFCTCWSDENFEMSILGWETRLVCLTWPEEYHVT